MCFRPTRAGFATKDFLIVAGINELNDLFVLYHLICLVYTKKIFILVFVARGRHLPTRLATINIFYQPLPLRRMAVLRFTPKLLSLTLNLKSIFTQVY